VWGGGGGGARGRSCAARAPVCGRATAREMTREREGSGLEPGWRGRRARADVHGRRRDAGRRRRELRAGAAKVDAFAEKVGPPFAPPRWHGWQRGERWARLFDIRGPTPFAPLCSIRCAIYPDTRLSLSSSSFFFPAPR